MRLLLAVLCSCSVQCAADEGQFCWMMQGPIENLADHLADPRTPALPPPAGSWHCAEHAFMCLHAAAGSCMLQPCAG